LLESGSTGRTSRTPWAARRAATHRRLAAWLLIAGGPGWRARRAWPEEDLPARAESLSVSPGTVEKHVTAILANRPELICIGVAGASMLSAPLAAATVVAVGPGLGTGPWARGLLDAALASGKPIVLDADALNLMAATGSRLPEGASLTPHPGKPGACWA
jgi:NAD(P)H-hydrate epimerase